MVGKTALNKEMKHLNGAYFRTKKESFQKFPVARNALRHDILYFIL